MKRLIQRIGMIAGLSGIIIGSSILAGGCFSGTWDIGNKAITKKAFDEEWTGG
jgi:hypothetical protein